MYSQLEIFFIVLVVLVSHGRLPPRLIPPLTRWRAASYDHPSKTIYDGLDPQADRCSRERI